MSTSSPARGARPSVIVLVADDLGWGDLGCYGATKIPTPHIDALAARGAALTDCHAASAVCTPSRYSLMTGRYPWRSPLDQGVLGGTDPAIIRPGQATLGTRFRAHGYRTGAFGKWHLGMDWTHRDGSRPSAFGPGRFVPDMQADGRDVDYTVPVQGGPTDHGFDRYFGIPGSLDMPPYCFIDQDRTLGIPDLEKEPLVASQRPGYQVAGWHDDHTDPRILEETKRWILASDENTPFFAYVASAAPHRPCVPPEFVRGTSDAGARGDSVVLVDWMVGELIGALTDSGRLANTIFVLTSDNGAPMIFPEDGDVVDHRPNGDWRGQKGDAWEGGHRVPFVVAGPGIPAGTRPAVMVSLVDVLPTVLDLLGSPPDPGLDGASLFQLIGQPTEEPAPPGTEELAPPHAEPSAPRVIAQQAFNGILSLRSESEKVVFGDGSGGFSAPVGEPRPPTDPRNQFFDLDHDPGERHNLWDRRAVDALTLLDRFTTTTGLRLAADGLVAREDQAEPAIPSGSKRGEDLR